MGRLHLLELGDQPWCPAPIRRGITDHLYLVESLTRVYAPAASKLADALRQSASTRVLDLGSGSGGPWSYLLPALRKLGVEVEVRLSDLRPDPIALQRARRASPSAIAVHPEPIDAIDVPAEVVGFRTLFTAFHHLAPDQARAALADAVAKGQGIAVFEAMERRPLMFFLLAFVPWMVLLLTPFTRPLRWTHLLFTYVVPVLPFAILFDGVVSCLRTYSPGELRSLTEGLEGYRWETGRIGGRVVYLTGVPR